MLLKQPLILLIVALSFLTGCKLSEQEKLTDFGDATSIFYEKLGAPEQIYLPTIPNFRRVLQWDLPRPNKYIVFPEGYKQCRFFVAVFDYVDGEWKLSSWFEYKDNQKSEENRIDLLVDFFEELLEKDKRRGFIPDTLDKKPEKMLE